MPLIYQYISYVVQDPVVVSSPCEPNPCVNGRCAVMQDDSFYCVCNEGYQGTTCSECKGAPDTYRSVVKCGRGYFGWKNCSTSLRRMIMGSFTQNVFHLFTYLFQYNGIANNRKYRMTTL